jgi:hypothetical protein
MLLRVSKKLVRELRRVKSCHAVHGEDLAQTIPRKRYNNTTPFLHTSKPPPLTSSTAPLEKPSRRSSVDSYRHQRIPPSFLLLPGPIRMSPPRPIRYLSSRRPTTRATARRSSRPPGPIRYTSWATTSPRHTTTSIHANLPPRYQCTRRHRFH